MQAGGGGKKKRVDYTPVNAWTTIIYQVAIRRKEEEEKEKKKDVFHIFVLFFFNTPSFAYRLSTDFGGRNELDFPNPKKKLSKGTLKRKEDNKKKRGG